MNRPLYVPFIKGKENDVIAVGKLSRQVRERIKPLVEAMPVDPKSPNIDEHVHKLCRYVRRHAPLGSLYVDFFGLMPDAVVSDGTNATLFGYQLLKGLGRHVTPVYGLERNDELWTPLGLVAEGFGLGFAFRLRKDDIAEEVIDETWSAVLERSAQLGLDEDDIDIVIDLGSLSDIQFDDARESVVSFLAGNPRAKFYRNIVVAGSSALRTVGEIEKEDVAEVRRAELYLWSDLWNDLPDEIRPVYGDYGVVHPDFSDVGPNKNINAKIRYTAGDRILYFRGHGLHVPVKDFEQYRGLAKKVLSDPRAKDVGFSFGDKYMNSCAKGYSSPGTPSTWIRADMNHHMTYVSQQIQRLIADFANTAIDSNDVAKLLSRV